MIILDTNVVSEGFRPNPHPALRLWMNSQQHQTLFLCSPVLAEIRFGIELLPHGAKRDALQAGADTLEYDQYDGRILTFDVAAAKAYGRLAAARQLSGQPIGRMDAFIAAIAVANHADVATRDVYGFSGLGLNVINPFDFKP